MMLVEYDPAGQGRRVVEVVAAVVAEYVPGAQLVTTVSPVASQYVLEGHFMHVTGSFADVVVE
jgi:hypothetical protein